MSTQRRLAYHPQTDGQSERMVQQVASAIRVFIAGLDIPTSWIDVIPHIPLEINNTRSESTTLTPNEIVKGFSVNNIASILSDRPREILDKPKARLSVHDAMAVAALTMKSHYDRRHTTKFFNIDDRVYLRLTTR